ncbi:FHA domain-containing protein [bacterium]|nr:FHA domain-containing protein [bacterium]
MLVVLELITGAEVGRLIRVSAGETCKVGRTSRSDVTLAKDMMISGQHFQIRNDGDHGWLKDLNSRNGTRIDHLVVTQEVMLEEGQTISAGQTQFAVRVLADAGYPNSVAPGKLEFNQPEMSAAHSSWGTGSASSPSASSQMPPSSPLAPASRKRGGDDAPVFKYAKGYLPEDESDLGDGDESPYFSNFSKPKPVGPSPFPNDLPRAPGSPMPPWQKVTDSTFGLNPSLDFGADQLGEEETPVPEFGAELDASDSPWEPPADSDPAELNPSLVDIKPDLGLRNNTATPSNEIDNLDSSDDDPAAYRQPIPSAAFNWRNPDYPSTASPAIEDDQPDSANQLPGSLRGLGFCEDSALSGYPVAASFALGTRLAEFSPFVLIRELAKVARPVLSIHFLKAGQPVAEGVKGVPLRRDLAPEFASLGGPVLYCPEDLEPFREIIEQMWGHDAISCAFTRKDPQEVIRHFREGLFGASNDELPTAQPGPLYFAVFAPSLLSTFLALRDQETVDQLLGDVVEGVLTEVAEKPGEWQLFTKQPWTESLKKLGMNHVVQQNA